MTTTINAKSTGIGGLDVTCDASGSLGLQTGGVTALTIDTSQNITTAGNIRLNNGAADGAQVILASSGYSDWNLDNYSGRFRAYYNATEYFTIDSSGNVGIGTSTTSGFASGKLIVASSGDNFVSLQAGTTNASGINMVDSVTGSAVGLIRYQHASDAMDFFTNGSQRMIIDSSGNVLIGQSTNANGAKLAITGNGGGTTDDLTFNSTASTSDIQSYNSKPLCLNRFGNEVWINGSTDRGGFALQVNSTGVWGAGAYTNGSDARIKEDITPLDTGLDVVAKLNPVTYKYKEEWSKDQSIQTGFIAQDLIVALEGKNYVDGIVNQSSEYMSVAYQNIIPILTKAIQEQQTIINDLKARIETLESK